ncbi:MAG: type II toxin-antitoxin system VapC family toxin [Pseudomonadota bacterium]
MIVVDTSSLLSILLKEVDGPDYFDFICKHRGQLKIGTVTFIEGIIASERHLDGTGGSQLFEDLCTELDIETVAFTRRHMAFALNGYRRFGKGRGGEPAALNFGDCLTYGFAMAEAAPILFKGDDFTRTDADLVDLSS